MRGFKKKTERYFYPAIFTYEDDKEISVLFPDLDVATSGEDETDALLSVKELLGRALYGLEEDKEPIPEPSAVNAVQVAGNQRAVLINVYMPSIHQAQMNQSVSRTVMLPAWLNAVAVEHNINFSQVLQEALKARLQSNN